MPLPWTDIPYLLELARNGTLGGAARALRVDRTTVSRRLDSLEKALGEPVFERTGGRYVLTAYGRSVFAAAEIAEQELFALDNPQQVESHRGGQIRVSMSEHLLMTLKDCFRSFVETYPDILLELTATDRLVDLKHFETDVALRITRGASGDLMTRPIGKPLYAIYRARDNEEAMRHYIARPAEQDVPDYVLKYAPEAKIRLKVDGLVSMREVVAGGFGIGILPQYFAEPDYRIVQCSDRISSAGFALSIVFRPEQRRLHRIQTFVDFLESYLLQMPGFEES